MKKVILIICGISLMACTSLETKNKVVLKDGTKVEIGVAVEDKNSITTVGEVDKKI